ncbi:MAG TPA: SufD family Fe-S cluster assembly protein [Terriglobia bacterium]|nr:SufD family Fe-S cluster assembly protein [Terriglobia bacterium]
MVDYAQEFAAIAKAYEASGGDPTSLFSDRFAGLVVSHNRILHQNSIPGVRIEGEETPTGAKAKITVAPGTVVANPVHLCFGVLPKEGLQEIISEFEIGQGAKVSFLAHCSFPNAVRVKHVMDAKIHVGRRAEMSYSETHYHGEDGGVEVLPVAKVIVEEGGNFRNQFRLVQGAAGDVRLNYEVDLGKDAVGELDARIYGKKQDRVLVKESLFLNGERARGLAKSRIVASDRCVSEVVGEAVGSAPGARGHVDCVEIIKGKDARASAIPKLLVVDDRAKLTHEAAIGSVDKKQIETLMARGLTEEEAVDAVVKGMLR